MLLYILVGFHFFEIPYIPFHSKIQVSIGILINPYIVHANSYCGTLTTTLIYSYLVKLLLKEMEFKMHTHEDSADNIWKGSWWELLEDCLKIECAFRHMPYKVDVFLLIPQSCAGFASQ